MTTFDAVTKTIVSYLDTVYVAYWKLFVMFGKILKSLKIIISYA